MNQRQKLDHLNQFTASMGDMLSDLYDCAFQEGIESVIASAHDEEKIEAAIEEALSDQDSMKDLLYRAMLKLGFGKPAIISRSDDDWKLTKLEEK